MKENGYKTKEIIIACEDIYGLDIYSMIEAINAEADTPKYRVIGFISNVTDPFDPVPSPVPVLGTIKEWVNTKDVLFVMAIRDPYRKEEAVRELKDRSAHFETLVAPWALHPAQYEAGEGCIFGEFVFKPYSRFGDFVIMDTVMCGKVEIGDYSTLCPFVNTTSTSIGKNVYIGSHAVIMSHLNVGDGSYICPGSIVIRDVKPGSMVAGVPATKAAAKNWEKNRSNNE